METDDLYAMGVFIVTLFIMTALQPLGKWVSFIGSMSFLVCGLFGIEYIFTVQASQYTYIHAVTRCYQKKTKHLHLFVTNVDSKEFYDGLYATILTLGVPVKLDPFGEFSKCVILHQYPYEVRMKFDQGKAKYKGFRVTHSKTCDVVLVLRKVVDTDHAEPIPVFWLKDAPGDIDIPPLQYLLPQTPVKTLDKVVEEAAHGRG
ncbi:hypothetical protein DRO69_00430 [Candidatus Bathyarchaeota archaeon]|nr:MAG: hypothetical protein DRO69_00430 [Candidatus Bathyarchaeota archaeon]